MEHTETHENADKGASKSTDEDPWSLRAALAGDAAAWTTLVDDFGSTMWYWARSQGLSREDAEDVCQTVWYVLKDKGHTIEDPRRLAGWLATTTKRQAINVSKRRARDTTTVIEDELSTLEADAPSPAELVINADSQARLAAAFNQLRERCKELLSLLWADVPYADIADMLSMAIGSIGETRRRCLDQLRTEAGIA